MIDIRQLSPDEVADDAVLGHVYDVMRTIELHGRENRPYWTREATMAAIRDDDPGERQLIIVATEDETVMGYGYLYLALMDNVDKAYFRLGVLPDRRREGIGTHLLAAIEKTLAAEGRSTIVAETKLPFGEGTEPTSAAGYRFAERHGYRFSVVEVVRDLASPVPEAALESMLAEADERSGAYRFETLVDEIPDTYIESLCALMAQLAVDAPTGEVDWEEEAVTPERLRHSRETTTKMGHRIYETVALDADDQVVAQTTIAAPAVGSGPAYQWGTFVHRQHRGHRLGLAVKVRNQAAMQRDMPEVHVVTTQNADENDWMIAINERMGFRATEGSYEFVKRLG